MSEGAMSEDIVSKDTVSKAGLWQQNAAQLLAATSSSQPTPGGGSVAAISGAFGTALLCMALEVTQRKRQKTGSDLSGGAQAALLSLQGIQRRLQTLADEDVAVFAEYMAALKLPKADEAQKLARKQALVQAGAAARQTPYEIAKLCVQALEVAQGCSHEVDQGIISDLGAGAALLRGAADAALLTLDINLVGLSGAEQAKWRCQRDEFSRVAQERAAALLAQVHDQIVGGAE